MKEREMMKHKNSEQAVIVGKRIKELRVKLELTQMIFAAKIGKNQTDINKWEAGKNLISLATLAKICEVFDVDLNFFFFKP